MPSHPFALPPGWLPRELAAFHRKLLAWFDASHRPLPWRASRDPYRIWVSEVMLQQTTVAAVLRYFDRFLEHFPTLEALANADEQDVLRQWEGLGYYRRARHLHAAAKLLVQNHATPPDDPAVWSELPGVGRYILGAVLSQAFDRKLPIVEANSLRLIARLLGYRGDPRTGPGHRWVWSAAEALLPDQRVGDFNQALMELGALICTPTAPKCEECPLKSHCIARRDGLQNVIPPPKASKVVTLVREVAVVVRDRGKVLLCQRPASAKRWANLWEVPHGERREGESSNEAAIRIAKELTGLTVRVGEEVLTIRHSVTRWSIEMVCLSATRSSGRFASSFYTEGHWVEVDRLADHPVSSPQRKLMRALGH